MSKIRIMKSSDLDSIIRVHMDAFQGFFLTFLGPMFLQEFYWGVFEDYSGIALVYDDQSVCGFAVGTTQPSGFYKRLIRRRWWKFALAALQSAVRKPSIIPRLLRALTLPSRLANSQPSSGTLLSLAVMSSCQGRGIGKQLVSSFLENSRKRGVEFVNLTTDAVDNEATNAFYLRLGFTCTRTMTTPEGRLLNEYVIPVE